MMWCCPNMSGEDEEVVVLGTDSSGIVGDESGTSNMLQLFLQGELSMLEECLQREQENASTNNSDNRSDEPLLIIALRHGSDEAIKLLVDRGASIERVDGHGKALMHYVACTHRHELLEYLIKAGASTGIPDSDNMTPLHYAAVVNEVINGELLIRGGADINAVDNKQATPLMMAAKHGSADFCHLLLQLGGLTINAVDSANFSALHHACRGGHLQCAEVLLKQGVYFGQTSTGESELMLAVKAGSNNLVKQLVDAGVDLNHLDRRRMTALHYAACTNNVSSAKLICVTEAVLDVQDRKGQTPLMVAARHGHAPMVCLLIDSGSLLNVPDSSQLTALHLASLHGHVECVMALLKAKARVDIQAQNGNQALMLAAHNGHSQVVKLLLSALKEHRHWNLNVGNKDMMTALHMAADKGHIECVDLLLNEGADACRPNKNGDTPLMLAAKRGHTAVVRTLVRNISSDPIAVGGVGMNQFNVMRKTALHMAARAGSLRNVEVLVNAGAVADVRDAHGKTPLVIATEHGHHDVVEALIKGNADVQVKTDEGWSTLHLAAQNNHAACAKLLLSAGVDPDQAMWMNGVTSLLIAAARGHYSIIKILLKKGANINHADFSGLTALHKAARGGHVQCVKLLLHNGATVDSLCQNTLTPASLALGEGHRKVLRILLQANCDLTYLEPLKVKTNRKFLTLLELLFAAGKNILPSDLREWGVLQDSLIAERLPRPLVDNPEIIERLREVAFSGKTLQQMCRENIRSTLGYNIVEKTDSLPLPMYLRDYILLKELKDFTDLPQDL